VPSDRVPQTIKEHHMRVMFMLGAAALFCARADAVQPCTISGTGQDGQVQAGTVVACGALTMNNFQVLGTTGDASGIVDTITASDLTGTAVVSFNPNLFGTQSELFLFRVSGGINQIKVSTAGQGATVTETACANPIPTAGGLAFSCTDPTGTLPEQPLAQVAVASTTLNQPMISPAFATAPVVYIIETIAATGPNARLSQFASGFDLPLTISPGSPLPSGDLGVGYSTNLTVTGGTGQGYTWSITAGALPNGLALSSGANCFSSVCQILGTPTASGTSNFTLQVVDSGLNTATAAFALTINPAPVITTGSPLPPGTQGANYLQTLAVSGGTAPFLWQVQQGEEPANLPAGLSLNSSTGQISGIPTAPGTSNFTILVTDSYDLGATMAFALTINPPPLIVTQSLPNGTVGVNYAQTVVATGGTPPLVWNYTGTLPAGLLLNSGSGLISGIPTAAGTSNFTILVSDSYGVVASQALSITTYLPLTITTNSPLPGATEGANYSQTLIASGGSGGYNWSLPCLNCNVRLRPRASGNALPPGLSLNSATGQISGVPTTPGITNFTIEVTDSTQNICEKAFSLTVNPPPAIATNSLPAGTVGAIYSQTVVATGGTAPLVWTVSAGALPAGLSLNSSTGLVSGTPTAAGTSNITLQVTDANASAASKPFTLTIASALVIGNSSPLPPATVGANYTQVLAATGGTAPLLWTVTAGALPAGLALNSGTGQITGKPTAPGAFNFTIQVADANGATGAKPFALTVNPAPAIGTTALPAGTVGVPYSQAVAVTGGTPPLLWTVNVGTLPAGLSLNSGTGLISGTPTVSGTYTFGIQVTDSNQATASKVYVLVVSFSPVITSNSPLPGGSVGASYSQTLAVSGGTPPYTWSLTAGTLPAGLSLNSATGQISGTPTTAATSSFTIQVVDSQKLTANKSFALVVSVGPVITTTSPLPAATASAKYLLALKATGGTVPYIWTLSQGSLPAGLSLNSATGAISGTPTVAGAASFTVEVTDANLGTSTAPFTLTVNPGLSIPNAAFPNPSVGAPYSQTISLSGGTAPFTYALTAGALPAGLTLNSASGLISGTPTTTGTASFTIQITDSNGATVSQQFKLTVNPQLTITTASPLAGGTAGVTYSLALLATGGAQPYTWAVSAGALPAGLSLNSGTGQIGGKPTAGGTANFTVQVTDSNKATATAQFALTIASNPAIVTATLPSPALGATYSAQLSATGTGAPFAWSISGGALPDGLTLSSGGMISGKPSAPGTFTFTVLVTDAANNTTTSTYTLIVPQVPLALTIQAPSGPASPQQQLPITLTLPQAYPVDLAGELVLQFTPNPATPVVDPAIQFSSGGGTVTFQIPAGQTSAVFAQSPLMLQTGTVAGSIVLTATATAGGVAVTLSNSPEVTLSLPQEPPVFSAVVQPASSGFNVVVTGYSNTRDITQATFTFAAQAGTQIQTTDFTPTGVAAAFQSWYASDASSPFGSQFLYTQPFSVTTGSASSLQSVTVTLTNSQGVSAAVTVTTGF